MTDTNDVSLRDYVDTLFLEKEKALQAALLAQEKAVAAALSAADKAVNKAEINAEKWRENANEWRGAMSDRDRELPSRREVDQQISGVETRLSTVEARQERGIGMDASAQRTEVKGTQWTIAVGGWVLGAAAIVTSLVALFTR